MDTVGPMNSGSKWSTKKKTRIPTQTWFLLFIQESKEHLLYLQCGKQTFAFRTNY